MIKLEGGNEREVINMYVLGIDVGTTGTKSMLISQKGEIISSAYKGYQLTKPGKSQVEQRAEDWWDALVETVRKCTNSINDKQNIIAMSLSTQGGSLVPVDVNGTPLSNVIVWMDKRAIAQRQDLLASHGKEFFYEKTGWGLSAGGNLVQIRWIRDNNKELFSKTYKFLSTIEYINFKLTGKYVIDPTNGGMTNLMNINTGTWDPELVCAAGIEIDKLAEVMDSGAEIGTLTHVAASELGLDKSVKVINGGHDQYCTAVSAGAFSTGQVFLATGTAWVILGTFKEPIYDNVTHIAPGRHIVKDLWGGMVTVPTGGVSMEWFKDNFALKLQSSDGESQSESFKEIDQKASQLMERAESLFFYPYYSGSRYPNYSENSKASFMGLGLEHTRYDMALSIMEGVAFEAYSSIEHFDEKGCSADVLRVLGGASKSDLWTNIISAVAARPVLRFKEADFACIGAGIVAGVGCGMFKDYKEGYESTIRGGTQIEATKELKDYYKIKYNRYRKGINAIDNYYNLIKKQEAF